ncbi:tRNA (N6-threonylcarbamoyladenosine(37)-N6)-methyltransferase TrmO [Clostridium niameyense]|uniref:tRNA (N6-threonylcarbamoyladenosine(37)-N6)-methyltransferase TrmO n=1 Tax=Clostridium niameyense TaxID=1622073 RepID=A0A6M0RD93_9CLOT|nr:tRNA (N6-threonylcarbamoyladenosine(37)-N6)-methyltransferase TrmO [Clostridium niameyense]NEZ47777.1 tRNA (N6-threonylcarbamoyladenosine(37)-N6)-methyltransferase TrmO [Clostridium niameyense]
MTNINFNPIGYIKSPFEKIEEIPPQSIYANDKKAIIEINQEYVDGLKGLDKLSHIIVLFYFNKSKDYSLITHTPWSKEKKGVFSTRSPRRPNAIGLSIVKLLKVTGNKVIIQGVDMLHGTPILDIKPYSKKLNP